MNKAKISITSAEGTVKAMESDVLYGCAMNRTEKEDGTKGVSCQSFLVGGRDIPGIHMAEPMGASVSLIIERVAEGDTELELAMLEIVHDEIARRANELLQERKGGRRYAGNQR